jgi:hypothetical protein
MRRSRAGFALLLVLSAFGSAAAEPDALTLTVSPRVMTAESDVWVRVLVARDARSRALDIAWWSDEGGGGAHLITLEGDRAARYHQFRIVRLEPGAYEVAATLTRSDGTHVRRTLQVFVVSRQ